MMKTLLDLTPKPKDTVTLKVSTNSPLINKLLEASGAEVQNGHLIVRSDFKANAFRRVKMTVTLDDSVSETFIMDLREGLVAAHAIDGYISFESEWFSHET